MALLDFYVDPNLSADVSIAFGGNLLRHR